MPFPLHSSPPAGRSQAAAGLPATLFSRRIEGAAASEGQPLPPPGHSRWDPRGQPPPPRIFLWAGRRPSSWRDGQVAKTQTIEGWIPLHILKAC